MHLHPVWLSWYGYVLDHLFFLARLTLDYANDHRGILSVEAYSDLFSKARRFARFAVRMALDCAEVIVHELGHIYADGGHCNTPPTAADGNNCCFGFAGARLVCGVTQALGLPPRPYVGSYAAVPYGRYAQTLDECHYDPSLSAPCFTRCDVAVVGRAGAGAEFCANSCAGSSTHACEEIS